MTITENWNAEYHPNVGPRWTSIDGADYRDGHMWTLPSTVEGAV